MRISLEVMDEVSDELRKIVEIGLADHTTSANVPPRDVRLLSVVARSDAGSVIGALLGRTVWGWLHVSELWVAERYRRKGIGRGLMNAAERTAVERGCYASYLDTFDFQAVSFYQLLGYSTMGVLEDFPFGHTRFFLQKRLITHVPNEPLERQEIEVGRKPGAFAVILDGSRRVLLCHRTDRDAWNLPGGGIEDNESPWDAVVREVLEEVKLHVRVERLLGVYFMPSDQSTAYTFSCTCDGASPQPSDEADEVQWFEFGALPSNTLPRHIERIRDAFSPQAGTILRVQA